MLTPPPITAPAVDAGDISEGSGAMPPGGAEYAACRSAVGFYKMVQGPDPPPVVVLGSEFKAAREAPPGSKKRQPLSPRF